MWGQLETERNSWITSIEKLPWGTGYMKVNVHARGRNCHVAIVRVESGMCDCLRNNDIIMASEYEEIGYEYSFTKISEESFDNGLFHFLCTVDRWRSGKEDWVP